MTLSELLDAVGERTNRPDRVDEILLAVQEATLFCHSFEFFRRDIAEVPVVYTTNTNPVGLASGQLIYDTVLPAFRKISYWRKWDPVNLVAGTYLDPVEPDKLFDSYGAKKQDKYYLAGRVLNWLSCSTDKAHIIGYWRFPDISKSRYASWIAEQQPFAIINWATAKIFRTVGQQDEAKVALADAEAQLQVIQTNDIESSGR